MKALVIGANGRTGQMIVKEALHKNWQVAAYLRNKAKLSIRHPNLSFVEGDAYNAEKINEAVKSADIVISALGQSDISGAVNLMSDAMKLIVPAMKQHAKKRVLAVGGMGALQADKNTFVKDLPNASPLYKNVGIGHFKVFEVLRDTDLDWTFVCCPYILDGEKTGTYQVLKDYMPKGKGEIFTGDIADFIVKEIEQNKFLKTRVGISY